MCKKSITNSHPFVKKMKNVRSPGGGDFFLAHTVYKSLNPVTVKIRRSSKNAVLTKTVRRPTNTNHTDIFSKQ